MNIIKSSKYLLAGVVTGLTLAASAMPLGASEAMSYNELDITVNSYWDTTGRTGVAVETDSCEFPDDLEISAFDIQWSGEFDLSTTKCGLMLIVR